ncbi:MAG TPA: transposase, partial [Candidatus Dormibacteraeota bacterium]|nr:transposase [Candidatus Dormibacteraeota bacterium]
EADLVAHSGPVTRGSFLQTLVLTDIATGWTECAPLLVREQRLLTEVLGEMRKLLPFPLLGLDTDNDSVFMNETVRDYCLDAGIVFTRCRPYRKNDQAWIEQKNGSVVRRTVGYRRFEGVETAVVLARLYASLRLFVNFFQPSFKLAAKAREGAKVTKRYHSPATPCQRLLADARTSDEIRCRLEALRETLDPVHLLREIRAAQQQLVIIADAPVVADTTPPTAPTLEQFLSGLRTAWREGEVRPTSIAKAKPKRSRRRPDPFAAVTTRLREWFEAEPWRTSRELFERLQAEYPGVYPDGQLRTCQRRLKEWRRENAVRMVFGTALVDGTLVDSQQCPVDLPLRLDGASTPPTTPQGHHLCNY